MAECGHVWRVAHGASALLFDVVFDVAIGLTDNLGGVLVGVVGRGFDPRLPWLVQLVQFVQFVQRSACLRRLLRQPFQRAQMRMRADQAMRLTKLLGDALVR